MAEDNETEITNIVDDSTQHDEEIDYADYGANIFNGNDDNDEVDHNNSSNIDTTDTLETDVMTKLDAMHIEGTHFSTAHNLTFATNKNIAEGMMDIALLSANANQLRFLITYNRQATFFYISLVLVIISLVLQLAVGIGLLVRRRWRLKNDNREPCKTNTFIVGGIFLITMVNILLAALTTTDNNQSSVSDIHGI